MVQVNFIARFHNNGYYGEFSDVGPNEMARQTQLENELRDHARQYAINVEAIQFNPSSSLDNNQVPKMAILDISVTARSRQRVKDWIRSMEGWARNNL